MVRPSGKRRSGETPKRGVQAEAQPRKGSGLRGEEEPTKRAPPTSDTKLREDRAPEWLADDDVRQAIACAVAAN